MRSHKVAMLSVCLAVTVSGEPLSIKVSSLNSTRSTLHPNEQIELRLSRALQAEERLALIAGDTDITALIEQSGQTIRFTPMAVLLGSGETEFHAYLISSNQQWTEAGTIHIKVAKARTAPSMESGEQVPSFFKFQQNTAIQFRSQPLFRTTASRPFLRTFQELSIQSSLVGRLQGNGWKADMMANVSGVNLQKQAIRYSLMGDSAPQVDLASYSVAFESKRIRAWIGDQSFGNSRHLLNNLSTRGLRMQAQIGSRYDVSVAMISGGFVQGFANPLGIEDGDNRILTATFGAELRKSEPGAVRVEVTGLTGSMKLPFSTFAQQSSGIGARFVGSLWKQRLTWEAGMDRSVAESGAHDSDYEDVSLQILRNIAITKRIKSSWTLAYRGERLDAGFESIGAFVQPDRAQHQFEASGNIGALQFVLNHGRFEDNLNQTEYQWKTYTHQTSLMAELPFREFLGVKKDEKKWLPRVTYTYFGLRNFSADLPKGADPEEGGTLPDQRTEAHSVSVDWGRKTRIGYRFSFDGQAGYRHFTHTAVYAFQWAKRLEVSGEAGIEETEQTDALSFSGRIGARVKWKPTSRLTLSVNINGSSMRGNASSLEALQSSLDAQALWKILAENPKTHHPRIEWYARYSNRYQFAQDLSYQSRSFYKTSYFQTGFTVTL